ncbi:hypothetical protein [Chroococcus sp. FPU101]|uniref:hypothetical protein n=1 Tax=Chroococcus sp. FPU101 TaxID=1974212 RepID=UPI001A8E479C|nr:hypothetical protein [Chroococcus sp. FPU101]GFE68441.1 hypothetical protein CFPU101_10510 [Chroococcus sp. FPU101]
MEQEETIRPDWPTISERVCVPAFEDYIQRNSSQIHQFIAKKGDVLIWHGRLTHRGSLAKNPNLMRKGLISHYSALSSVLICLIVLSGIKENGILFTIIY